MLLRDAPDRASWAASAGFIYGGWSASGQTVNPRTATSLPVFSACISLLSSTLASQRWGIEKRSARGRHRGGHLAGRRRARDHGLPTKEKFVADALVFGTAYATRATDRAGRVTSLAVLPCELVLPQLYTDRIDYRFSDPLSGQQSRFSPDDLAILKYRNWGFRPWLGIPPLLAIGDSWIGLVAASAFE